MEYIVAERTKELSAAINKLHEEVTIRSAAEKQSRINEERFGGIYNAVNESILIIDAFTEEFVDVNIKTLEMFKCSKELIMNLSRANISNNAALFSNKIVYDKIQMAAKGENFLFEWQAKDFEGNSFWCETSMTGAIIGEHKFVIVTVRDISNRKEIEAELNNYRQNLENLVGQRTIQLDQAMQEQIFLNDELHNVNEQLESQRNELMKALDNLKIVQAQMVESEKMAALGILISGLAHEINNPLNYIVGSTHSFDTIIEEVKASILDEIKSKINSLKKNEKSTDENILLDQLDIDQYFGILRKLITYIMKGTDRITEIVKSLRLFSRSDDEVKHDIDIHEYIDSAIVMLDYQLKDRIRILKEYSSIPKYKCYPGKFSQLIMNLLVNAIQAIENEGLITIKTYLSQDKTELFIAIKDNGCGIPDEIKEKIFEPFFTTKEVGKGIGLGLSIVFGIVEQHNGRITLLSKVNEGTEFIIALPC